jgi:vancomycin resistance protein YoaR
MKFAQKFCKILKRALCVGVLAVAVMLFSLSFVGVKAFAMPFYDLRPESLALRASFFTSYASSSAERKHNIALASKSLNNTFVDVNGEFSFNYTVGERTMKRGYKQAKIIVGGEFVDGVGGGVCQVSTTLYNAVLLAGLKVIEYHPHSLPVSYVAPSFDAMVNSSWADLKFINTTHNPIIIKAVANGERLLIEIWGQKMQEKYVRESVVLKTLPPLADKEIFDDEGAYPELYEGDFRKVKWGNNGYVSEGYLTKIVGKKKAKKKIRSDKYSPTRGLVVWGKTKKVDVDESLSVAP